MLKLYFFYKQFFITPTRFDMSLSSLSSFRTSIKTIQNTDGLLNTLKFVHKICVDVVKLFCSTTNNQFSKTLLQQCHRVTTQLQLINIIIIIIIIISAQLETNFIIPSNILCTNFNVILISNFHRVLNVVCFLLGDSPASEIYMPTFRNTLSLPSSQAGRCLQNELV